MAFDELQADRVRDAVSQLPFDRADEIGEIKMFGGLCFTLNGKMLAGVGKERVMLRLSDEDFDLALGDGHVDPMDFTGKPMSNFAYLAPAEETSSDRLALWVRKSYDFVKTLPAKKPKSVIRKQK